MKLHLHRKRYCPAGHDARASAAPRPNHADRGRRSAIAGALLAVVLAGCSTQITKHGNLLSPTDVQNIQPGMSSDQVRMSLGTPATTAAVGQGEAYYYISSTMHETTLGGAKEVDRRVTAVYFTPTGGVDRIASYGMKDGKVFDFLNQTTPSATSADKGILTELFRNLGQRTFGIGGDE